MTQKTHHNLAILGGSPAFDAPLHVGSPNLGDYQSFMERLQGLWERNWLTNDGPLVREFEQQIASLLNVDHAVAVCNGTVGLEIAVRATGLTGEVIVPAFTFVATAHCVRWQGLTPIFCDVEPDTHNIDPEKIEQLITDKTSGILAVHLWGQPCAIDALSDIADRHNLKLIFDASHAIGNSFGDQPIGAFGDVEVFSLHATKVVNAFEGGIITTNNPELAETMRLMRNFGFSGYDNVIHVGTNGKMPEVSAAMGLTSLESRTEFFAHNRANLLAYQACLQSIPGIRLLIPDECLQGNAQYVVCEIDSDQLGLTRDQLLNVFHQENVRVRRYFYPGCHKMAPYHLEPQSTPIPVPVTDQIAKRVMQFPTGMHVTETEIAKIKTILEAIQQHAESIKTMLPAEELVSTELESGTER